LAAHRYASHEVGVAAAAISAMTLVSGASSLGLSSVLVRYLPVAGTATRKLIVASYAVTAGVSLAAGAVAALTSRLWSPKLSFLSSGHWVLGFALATAGTTIFTLQDAVLTGLRAAQWIPLENALYAFCKLAVLLAVPAAKPFVAWNAPLLPAVVLINVLIFGRVMSRSVSFGMLQRRTVLKMAGANYAGNLFLFVSTFYLPILVANVTTTTDAAHFYVPWLVSVSIQLVAVNMMTSLTVQGALDQPNLRHLARRAVTHSLRLVLPIVAFILILAPTLLRFFGADYARSGAPLLRWLAIGAIPNVFFALGISIARVRDESPAVIIVQGANAALLIAMSAALLSRIGIVAVGIAWTASQTLLAIILLGTVLRPVLRRAELAPAAVLRDVR
jgi:O-antigen/teichoic acid export membrane protein